MSINILTAITMLSSIGFLVAQFFTKKVPIRVFILITTFSLVFLLLLFEDNSFISIGVLIIYVNALAIIFLFTLMVFMKIEEAQVRLSIWKVLIFANLIVSLCYSTPKYLYERLQINEIKSILAYSNIFDHTDQAYWDMYEFVNSFYTHLWHLILMCGLLLLISIICVVVLTGHSANGIIKHQNDFKRE